MFKIGYEKAGPKEDERATEKRKGQNSPSEDSEGCKESRNGYNKGIQG